MSMDSIPPNKLCPCLSGRPYDICCGKKGQRGEIDVIVNISDTNGNSELTAELQSAMDNANTLPDLFPVRINFFSENVQYVKMSPQWYRESVFLDPGRILGRCILESDLHWLQSFSERVQWQPMSIIFHTAFCGSTLMSKALDSVFNCLPLREPDALGNLLVYMNSQKSTADIKQSWLDNVMRVLSRRYQSDQAVVVKANDYANGMMSPLVNWHHDIPMLFMYTPLNEFVAGCLKADNRRQWIRNRYKAVENIAAHLLNVPSDLRIDDESDGAMAAFYWSYNIALFLEAWRQSPHRLRSLDFNLMLARPLESIEACGQLFGLQSITDTDSNKAISEHFGTYSKNIAFKYSPQQRSNDIDKLLDAHQSDMVQAESVARQLLQTDYPDTHLPGKLLD